jgi:hypothetical protein
VKSTRVLVRVAGFEDWRGDDLRFAIGSDDAVRRRDDLRNGHQNITETRITTSDDEPTHTYEGGHLVRLRAP